MVEINSNDFGVTNGETYDSISMELPSKPEYVGVVRLTVSAIANRMGFNIEEIEDIKVAVAEACTNAIKHGLNQDFNVCFDIFEEKITVSIKDNGKGYNTDALNEPDLEDPKEEGGLGIFIIKSLMDEVTLKSSVGQGTEIKMIKFLGDGN